MSRWWVCVSGWSVCVSEQWVFIIPRVLVPQWRPCMSWWETPGVTLLLLLQQGVLGTMGRIIWKEKRRQSKIN